jgi:hypothetical protein
VHVDFVVSVLKMASSGGVHRQPRRRARLPDGRAKMRILRAVDRARGYLPLRAVLRFLRVSPSRFHAWCRRQRACALDDQSSCPRTSPYRLTPPEVRTIEDMVTAPEYRHVPTGTLAVLAQQLGKVWASPSTWYRLVRQNGWRRPRLRVHPAKPKIGLRTTRADEMWHIDTTVIRLLDGTRAYGRTSIARTVDVELAPTDVNRTAHLRKSTAIATSTNRFVNEPDDQDSHQHGQWHHESPCSIVPT